MYLFPLNLLAILTQFWEVTGLPTKPTLVKIRTIELIMDNMLTMSTLYIFLVQLIIIIQKIFNTCMNINILLNCIVILIILNYINICIIFIILTNVNYINICIIIIILIILNCIIILIIIYLLYLFPTIILKFYLPIDIIKKTSSQKCN